MMEQDKELIRRRLRARRRALNSDMVQRHSAAICQRAQESDFFRQARSVALYLATDNEVDPSSLLHAASLAGKAIYLPVVDRQNHALQLVRYRPGDPLRVGAYAIREPLLPTTTEVERVEVTDLDILYLPLIAFDRTGWRLGYGGGYYDRLLGRLADEACKPLRIGLAYHFQLVADLPHAAHDVPMDRIVTEQEEILRQSAAEQHFR
ncbi:MAG: 5-formyltetrahydrofolate cyclo-ligase [Magnetococcales bacterium]|nr:5-formyltetrahydrofolate cyclo-ligase [Magnetococcales bacterium]